MKLRYGWGVVGGIVGLLGLCLLGRRLFVLQAMSYEVLGCRACVVPNVLASDVPYWAVVVALFVVSFGSRGWLWRGVWRGVALLGVALYAADMWVMSQFSTRLMLADIRVYTADTAQALALVLQWPLLHQLLVVGGLVLGAALWWWPVSEPISRRGIVLCGIALAGLGGGAWAYTPPGYVHEWALKNVVQANWPTGLAAPYSHATQERLLAERPPEQCWAGRDQRDHVVMLVLESWSTYHSQAWLGVNDWTPRLDAWAAQGRQFETLYAGGFNTNEGLFSLLTGRDVVLPILPAHQQGAFEGAWGIENSLPAQLGKQGYQTTFMTSGNLAYTRKGEWLSQLGFEALWGHDAPAFDGVERGHFGAVPDDVLYSSALAHITRLRQDHAASLTVIENVSSHHPYVHPYSGERSEEAVFRYMDKAAGEFIDQLAASGFLEEGTLVVVSDHRAMTFVTAEEQARFGLGAVSRIPGFMLGRGVEPGKVTLPFHQADIMPTLLRQQGERVCLHGPLRDGLDVAASEPRCMMHARGDQRDRVNVYCPEGKGTIKVMGDDSYFVNNEGLESGRRQQLLDALARQRLALEP